MVLTKEKYQSNMDFFSINHGILGTIGNTPLINLERVIQHNRFQLFGKLEMFNPGGSIKDRPAFNMLKKAFELGKIDP